METSLLFKSFVCHWILFAREKSSDEQLPNQPNKKYLVQDNNDIDYNNLVGNDDHVC